MGASAIAVDTACSAALSAIHIAASGALHLDAGDGSHPLGPGLGRETTWSLCGGANLMLGAAHSAAIAAAGMLAPDGRCKALDAAADGYGRGEAVAAGAYTRPLLSSTSAVSDTRAHPKQRL